jgi:putative DNA primase/helicase
MLFDEKKFRECLPAEMLAEKRFVRYFLKPKPEGGTAKIPLGNHSDPNTWSTFDDCVKAIENNQQGIGYCFLGGNIHGLDIDHCRNPRSGQLCNEAMLLLSRVPSWAEYSVSGAGLHVFFKGEVRGKQLTETCLQYWNPKNSPRFFALTCDMVGDAFKTLKDIGEEFNYIFATARHISAKIREELRTIDYEQWAALPAERVVTQEAVTADKTKIKTRKLHKDFVIADFLKFYELPVDNIARNNIGVCYRLATCPIKGEPHVGQNSTTTNFILSADGGLGFHCQSTGCCEYSVADAIKKLAEHKGPYPGKIYVETSSAAVQQQRADNTSHRGSRLGSAKEKIKKHKKWLWKGYLQSNQLHHFAGASSEGKSPVTRDLIGRLTRGADWPDGTKNEAGPRSVILLSSEDDWSDTILPSLELAGADLDLVFEFISTVTRGEEVVDVTTALDRDIDEIAAHIKSREDVGLVIIDPITNYLGSKSMNKEDEMRSILMPLAKMAQSFEVGVVTVGHLNKRDKDTALMQRLMGAAAFGGVARQVFMFGNDPDEEDPFAHVMGLLRKNTYPPLKYKTVAVPQEWDGQVSDIIQVKWCGPAKNIDMDEVVNARKQSDKTASKEAGAFIKAFLRDGAKPTKVIEEALKDAGIECSNFARTARKVAATRKVKGKGNGAGSEWYLPTTEQIQFDGNK